VGCPSIHLVSEKGSSRKLGRLEGMDRGHLTWFEGDALCEDCALIHGVL
jgi:hypothetical protein